jgi:hypothetical protein
MFWGKRPGDLDKEIFMRRFSVSLLLFVASAFTFGQQAPKSSPGPEAVPPIATTFPSNASTVDGCPVGLFVERRSDLVTRLAEDGRPTGPAQGLHIRLIHFFARIESAEITVYGVTSRASILPVGVAASASNEISKTFVLHPGEGRKGRQEATVWMEQAGVLTRVELNSLTYADGSVWHESEGSRCRAVPSLFLPVGAK